MTESKLAYIGAGVLAVGAVCGVIYLLSKEETQIQKAVKSMDGGPKTSQYGGVNMIDFEYFKKLQTLVNQNLKEKTKELDEKFYSKRSELFAKEDWQGFEDLIADYQMQKEELLESILE